MGNATCRVTLNRTTCTGIGLCEMTAPDVFEVSEDGRAVVKIDVVDVARLVELEEAALNCPTQSITVTVEDA